MKMETVGTTEEYDLQEKRFMELTDLLPSERWAQFEQELAPGPHLGQPLGIHLGRQAGPGEQRLHLRREQQHAAAARDEQRPDAEAVPGQEQAAGGPVVQAKGKHPPEALHAGRAPGLPGVEDHLRVAVSAELIAQGP